MRQQGHSFLHKESIRSQDFKAQRMENLENSLGYRLRIDAKVTYLI